MCNCNDDCETCPDFMECTTDDPKYIQFLEDAPDIDDDYTRWW